MSLLLIIGFGGMWLLLAALVAADARHYESEEPVVWFIVVVLFGFVGLVLFGLFGPILFGLFGPVLFGLFGLALFSLFAILLYHHERPEPDEEMPGQRSCDGEVTLPSADGSE